MLPRGVNVLQVVVLLSACGLAAGADAETIPGSDVPIPEPVVLPVEISWEPNEPGEVPYVPSQLCAPFPERLLPTTS